MEKTEVITLDGARELVGDAALWPRIRDFLWDFAPQVHESWLESLESLKVEGCKVEGSESPEAEKSENEDTPQSNPQLSNFQTFKLSNFQTSTINSPRVRRFILSSLGVEPFFHSFPKDDWSRLALLDGATLLEIAKWLGALACADELRRVTDGATVRGLKSALRGIYPEVFGYTEYFRKLKVEKLKVESLKVEGSMPDAIVKLGCGMLHSFLGELSAPLRRRLSLKLPRDLEPSNLQLSNFPTFNFQTSNMRLLLKLRYPEAYKICC